MTRQPNTSPQTLRVLRLLLEEPAAWHYGYEISQQTGLKSGTLYPILIRLADQGWLETCWGLLWSLPQQYGSLAIALFVLAGLGLVVALPVFIVLMRAIRLRGRTKWGALPEPERRAQSPLPFVLSIISLVMLLVLWLSGPVVVNQLLAQQGLATAGVVVRSADHRAAEAVFDQRGSLSHAEVYLTTQVKPLTVNGVPLVQLRQSTA